MYIHVYNIQIAGNILCGNCIVTPIKVEFRALFINQRYNIVSEKIGNNIILGNNIYPSPLSEILNGSPLKKRMYISAEKVHVLVQLKYILILKHTLILCVKKSQYPIDELLFCLNLQKLY